MAIQTLDEPLSRDQARARQVEIEIAENLATREIAGEALQLVQPARRVATTYNRADRGPGDDVRYDARLREGPQNPDMGPAAGGSTA